MESPSSSATDDRLALIEQKIDKLLAYQKTVKHLAVLRAVISVLFFLVFVILPIAGGFYLFRLIREHMNLTSISDQYFEFLEGVKKMGGR